MPLVALAENNVVEFRVHGLCQAQEVITRFHFRLVEGTPAGPIVTTEDCLNELLDLWRTNVLPVMLTSYGVFKYFCGRVIAVTRQGDPFTYTLKYDQQVVQLGVPATDVGTIPVVDQLPTFVAMDLRRVCVLTNKWTRGSVRLSPHNEADQTNGSWVTGRRTAIEAALNPYCGGIIPVIGGDVQLRHVVFSATQAFAFGPGPVWPTTGNVSENVNSYGSNALVSSQTSRKIRAAGY